MQIVFKGKARNRYCPRINHHSHTHFVQALSVLTQNMPSLLKCATLTSLLCPASINITSGPSMTSTYLTCFSALNLCLDPYLQFPHIQSRLSLSHSDSPWLNPSSTQQTCCHLTIPTHLHETSTTGVNIQAMLQPHPGSFRLKDTLRLSVNKNT